MSRAGLKCDNRVTKLNSFPGFGMQPAVKVFAMSVSAPIPANESKRLEALRRYRLLDTPREQDFDDFTLLASFICDTPIASISLIDTHRQWFKSSVGLTASETPRDQAFCAHTILQRDVMVVEDATRDDRFAENPLVTGAPDIRFYAGAPLVDQEGCALGSLCVIDRQPRRLSERQLSALQSLARKIMREIEFRRVASDLAAALEEIKVVRGLLPICAHCKAIRNDRDYWQTVESYIAEHVETDFSHGICDDCLKQHHPRVWQKMQDQKRSAAANGPSSS